MRRKVERAAALALTTTLVLAACADDPNQVQVGTADAESFFATPPAPGFGAMRRHTPLTETLVAHAVIGPSGGRIELDEAGVIFEVPFGALKEDTEITMRALAGDAVAFEFAPHGLEFLEPARILVRARGTDAEPVVEAGGASSTDGPLSGFMAVYYEGDPAHGVAPLENLDTYLVGESIAFDVFHFSGYVCASG